MRDLNGEFLAIESPFRGGDPLAVKYLHSAMRSFLAAGFIPLASHETYTRALADSDPEERALGIEAGFQLYRALGSSCRRVFCLALGVSPGMVQGLEDERMRQKYTNAQRPWVQGLLPSGADPDEDGAVSWTKCVIWPTHLPSLHVTEWETKEPVELAWTDSRVYVRYMDGKSYFVGVA